MKSKPRNAMTVDVEDYFHVAALKECIDPGDWSSLESRVERNTDSLLELFGSRSVTGTFFTLGWVAERFPGLVRKIADQGHEVACHGYSHQLVYSQSRSEFRQETLRAKQILEDVIGQPVYGYRAASYSITAQSLWALDILVEAGFSYDSSIAPIRHDLYGIPDAPRFPYRLELDGGHEIVEFPPSTVQLASFRVPVAGGGYFRIFPFWFSRWGMRVINNTEHMPFSFYLHPWDIDPEQPRFSASWFSRFRHYTNLHKARPRLAKLITQFDFDTMANVISDLDVPDLHIDALRHSA